MSDAASNVIAIECPHCELGGEVPRQFAGGLIKCKRCARDFRVPPLANAPTRSAQSAPSKTLDEIRVDAKRAGSAEALHRTRASEPRAFVVLGAGIALVAMSLLFHGAGAKILRYLSAVGAGTGVTAIGFFTYRLLRLRSPVRDTPKALVPLVFFGSVFILIPVVDVFFPEKLVEREPWQNMVALMLGSLPLGLAIAALRHARTVRVLFLRSFAADAHGDLAETLRRALSFVGRTEALRPPVMLFRGSMSWGLVGHDTRWREGVQALIDQCRLVVVDVSERSDNLAWELERLRAEPRVPRIYIARAGSGVTEQDGHAVLEYAGVDDAAFVERIKARARKAVEANARRPRRRAPRWQGRGSIYSAVLTAIYVMVVLIPVSDSAPSRESIARDYRQHVDFADVQVGVEDRTWSPDGVRVTLAVELTLENTGPEDVSRLRADVGLVGWSEELELLEDGHVLEAGGEITRRLQLPPRLQSGIVVPLAQASIEEIELAEPLQNPPTPWFWILLAPLPVLIWMTVSFARLESAPSPDAETPSTTRDEAGVPSTSGTP